MILKYLLDTNIVIDIFKRRPSAMYEVFNLQQVRTRLFELTGHESWLSTDKISAKADTQPAPHEQLISVALQSSDKFGSKI